MVIGMLLVTGGGSGGAVCGLLPVEMGSSILLRGRRRAGREVKGRFRRRQWLAVCSCGVLWLLLVVRQLQWGFYRKRGKTEREKKTERK